MNPEEAYENLLGLNQEVEAIRTPPPPKGWEPGAVWDGKKGQVTTGTLAAAPQDWSHILRDRGLDPDVYEVVGDSIKWTSFDGWKRDNQGEDAYSAMCYVFRAEIRLKRAQGDPLGLEELYKEARKIRKRDVGGGEVERTLVIALSDWQVGSGDAGGHKATIEAIAALPDLLSDQVRALKNSGQPVQHIIVAGQGDLGEGTCFAYETEVITEHGIYQIGDLAKKGMAVVKSEYGSWVPAEFKSFGAQPLVKLTLSRGGTSRKEVFVTSDHRWLRFTNPSTNSGREDALTRDLKPGDLLVSNFGKHPHNISPIGVMAGYVFGDGHRKNAQRPEKGSAVHVHRQDFGLLPYFEGHPFSEVRSKSPLSNSKGWTITENSDYVEVSCLPSFMKDLPPLNESLPYLYGWAAGYFAADGSASGGMLRLTSIHRENLEHFAAVCARLGIGTNPIRKNSQSDEFWTITLVLSTVESDFLVHPVKKATFEEFQAKKSDEGSFTFQKNRARCWRVESIEETDRVEEVYCAIVPETHTFTLANDLLTGNCGFYPSQPFLTELDRREQSRVVRRGIKDVVVVAAKSAQRVTVTCAGGNHGENRENGKRQTGFNDNDDVAAFEQVYEILRETPLDNIQWRIPQDEMAVSVEAHGQYIAFTHGHLAKPQKNAAEALWGWWSNHTMGRFYQGLADANILVAGHFHHLNVKQQDQRTVMICPSLTAVGDWYSNSAGVQTVPGTLTFTVDANGWDNLRILR